MGIFRQFPYSNFHEMNMDEILNIVKTMYEEWNTTKAEWASYKDFIDNYFANLDVSEEVLHALQAMAASGELNDIIDPVIVTETAAWLAEHLTPTSPPVDDTLSIQGAAADAQSTGIVRDNVYASVMELDFTWAAEKHKGYYINASDTEVESGILEHSDYIVIPVGTTHIKLGNISNNYHIYPNVLFYDKEKNLISYQSNSVDDIATYGIPEGSYFVRVNQPNVNIDPALRENLVLFITDHVYGYVGDLNVTMPNTASQLGTTFQLRANHPYAIKCNTAITGRMNLYIAGHTDTLVPIFTDQTVYFTPEYDGVIALFSPSAAVQGPVSLTIYDSNALLAKLTRVPEVYTVGRAERYKSLTKLLFDLKDNENEKIIYIEGGVYNIFQEYADLGTFDDPAPANPTFDYFPYCAWVPNNTHIIGRGLVQLRWEPTTSQISQGWSQTIAPLCVAGNAIIENIEVHCKNGRYCIHDDPLGKGEYMSAHKIYKNVKCYKYANDTDYGFPAVIGFGMDTCMYYEFDSCLFHSDSGTNAFYLHNRGVIGGTQVHSPNVKVRNCIMDTSGNGVRLGNGSGTSYEKIRVDFESCYLGPKVLISDEGAPNDGNNANTYDVTLLNCNSPVITIKDPTNPYPVKIFNPVV